MGCASSGDAGNVSPPPRVSALNVHHGTCVTHVPGCMPGSLSSSILWSRWRGKRSGRMRNPHRNFTYLIRGPLQWHHMTHQITGNTIVCSFDNLYSQLHIMALCEENRPVDHEMNTLGTFSIKFLEHFNTPEHKIYLKCAKIAEICYRVSVNKVLHKRWSRAAQLKAVLWTIIKVIVPLIQASQYLQAFKFCRVFLCVTTWPPWKEAIISDSDLNHIIGYQNSSSRYDHQALYSSPSSYLQVAHPAGQFYTLRHHPRSRHEYGEMALPGPDFNGTT